MPRVGLGFDGFRRVLHRKVRTVLRLALGLGRGKSRDQRHRLRSTFSNFASALGEMPDRSEAAIDRFALGLLNLSQTKLECGAECYAPRSS